MAGQPVAVITGASGGIGAAVYGAGRHGQILGAYEMPPPTFTRGGNNWSPWAAKEKSTSWRRRSPSCYRPAPAYITSQTITMDGGVNRGLGI